MKKRRRLYRLVWLVILPLIAATAFYFMRERKKIVLAMNTDETIYTPDTSQVYIPLSIALGDLQTLANEKIGAEVFHGLLPANRGKDSVDVKIRRTGNVVFHLNNGKLDATVPLEAQATYVSHLLGNINARLMNEKPFVVSVDALLETPITMTEDYGFDAKTSLVSLNWKKRAVLNFQFLHLDFTDKIQGQVFKNEKQITHRLDSVIQSRISLRNTIGDVWKRMQRPVRLGKPELKFYLTNQAYRLSMWMLPQTGDSLNMLLKLSSLLRIVNGDDTLLYKPLPLPGELRVSKTDPPDDDTSRLHVNMMLPLTSLEAYSNKRLSGKILAVTNHSIRLKEVKIVNGKENILVRLRCEGDISADLKLKGTPQFNLKERKLQICNLEFEADGNGLINSLDQVLHDLILDELQSSVNLDMEHVMDTIPVLIQNGIRKSKLAKKADVVVAGFCVTSIQPHLTRKYVQLIIQGNATTSMRLKRAAIVKPKT